MNIRGPSGSWRWVKISFGAGAMAVLAAVFLFGIKPPQLPAAQERILLCLFAASMATSSLTGYRWPLLGVLVVPGCFFGLSCLACWRILAQQ